MGMDYSADLFADAGATPAVRDDGSKAETPEVRADDDSGSQGNAWKNDREPHGTLIACSYDDYSGGMMFNSDASDYVAVELDGSTQKITHRIKAAFGGTITSVSLAKTDILAEIAALSERENLPALEGIAFSDPFRMTDVSYSTSIALVYDDRAVGGPARNRIHIDVRAMRWRNAGDIADEFRKILEDGEAAAEQVHFEMKEGPSMMGTMGMMGTPSATGATGTSGTSKGAPSGAPTEPDSDSGWTCKVCGSTGNTRKFCPECGSPRS